MPNRDDPRAAVRSVLLLLAALLVLPVGTAGSAQELVNRVVIRVNDRIATLYDYQQRVEELQNEINRREGMTLAQRRQRLADLPEDVFNTLFQEQLLLSRADQVGIVYTEEELDKRMAAIRQSYGVATEEEFLAIAEQQGLNVREFRDQVRTGMRIQELLGREVRSQLAVGEEAARVYYRDHPEMFMAPRRLNLRELVVLEESDLPEAERLELARSLRAELLAGRAIEELAEEYSALGVTSNAIDLGWVVGGDLARELQDAVWELQPNQVSEPVAGRGGLHLIQVVERQEEGLRPFNEVAEDAEARATNELMAEAMEEYMERLEDQSYVRLDPPPEAADFRRAIGEPLEELPEVAPADVTVAGDEDVADESPAAEPGDGTEIGSGAQGDVDTRLDGGAEPPNDDFPGGAGDEAAEAGEADEPPPAGAAVEPESEDGGR